jgi:shikimate kinase/3-dehydroquinate synthase
VTPFVPPALDRHIVLIGFMGAGKTTIGSEVARRIGRPFVDTDEEIERRHGPIATIFDERGEPEFRRLEEQIATEALAAEDPAVVALGGGAPTSEATRARLRRRAFTVWIASVDVEEAWERVRGSDRPLARDESAFRTLFRERAGLYAETMDAATEGDPDDVIRQALGVQIGRGLYAELATFLVPERGGSALVADERVAGLHPPSFDGESHLIPPGEAAKDIRIAERLWHELGIGRDGVLLALGGGSTTDLAGFVAATYMRGLAWVALPTTLVGQVDAAIGGKTGIDVPDGKNLVGAFHFPEAVVIDPDLLGTLPEEERRNGMAEVVKTGLLAGRPLWELPEEEMIRAAAAYKCAIVLFDPYEQGRRAVLNLGHTFGHALEAASDYSVSHGEAVALGLLAALGLSGQPTDVVEELLDPRPVRVDRERAWEALRRDKKGRAGRPRLVLLPAPGEPEYGVELPDEEVRAALDALIAD